MKFPSFGVSGNQAVHPESDAVLEDELEQPTFVKVRMVTHEKLPVPCRSSLMVHPLSVAATHNHTAPQRTNRKANDPTKRRISFSDEHGDVLANVTEVRNNHYPKRTNSSPNMIRATTCLGVPRGRKGKVRLVLLLVMCLTFIVVLVLVIFLMANGDETTYTPYHNSTRLLRDVSASDVLLLDHNDSISE